MTDMENQVRELFRDIAEDIPPQREVPPTLRPRARRRIAATIGVTVVVVGALVVGGVVAVRSIPRSSPRPVNPGPTTHVRLPDTPDAWQRIVLPDSAGCPANNCAVALVAAGDGGLVAMSYTELPSGKAFVGWSSSDGVSWHPIEGDVWQSVGRGHGIEDIAAAGPGFVAVGRTGVWASTDGASWDLVQPSTGFDWFQGVTAGGPGVVAVGRPNKAWFSSDGVGWEAAEVPPVPAGVYPGDNGVAPQVYMTSVAAGAGRFVATGNGPRIWVSSDGRSWRDVPIDGHVFPRECDGIVDLAGDPDRFVAVGVCGDSGEHVLFRSADGEHWERVSGAAFDGWAPYRVGAGPAGFIATGDQSVWTSVDGKSWTRLPTGSTFQAGAGEVTAWGSRLVVVGTTDDGHNVVWISGPQR